ncbi:MAG: hypothetical protein V2B20_04400 [Pseudomonadota bacterium]
MTDNLFDCPVLSVSTIADDRNFKALQLGLPGIYQIIQFAPAMGSNSFILASFWLSCF